MKDLHETTEYRIRGKDGNSDAWVPNRGLREGCPSSPPLFNIYHQAVMRVAAKERKIEAEERGQVAGVVVKWVPGSAFPSEKTWEKNNLEAIQIVLDKSLFADDTTVVGNKEEIDAGVNKTKEVMNRFEERNNDHKEEALMFGEEDSGSIRMLGSWMGWEDDVKQRLSRGRGAWFKCRSRLKGIRISKKMQARVIEVSVESTMLFDCNVRTWKTKEIQRMQSLVDRAYRQIWSSGKKAPLIEMQEKGVNMADIRKALGIKSLRWKIEKRILERIGHVMRMDDDRLVKAVVLGWVEQLENTKRVKGGRRKTVLYWKRLLREAAIDWTKIGLLTKDRKEWKRVVKERMDWLLKWEWSKGKKWEGESMDRKTPRIEEVTFKCELCDKVCRSKGGLTIHRKRIHEESPLKKSFNCPKCSKEFKQEANLKNHRKKCEKGEQVISPRVYVGKRGNCPTCGKEMAATNIARHLKDIHGGGANP